MDPTPQPGRRPAPTRARRSSLVQSRRRPASRPGTSGPAGTHTTGTRTGPPTRAPAPPPSRPAAPCRRSRGCRARGAFACLGDENPLDGPGPPRGRAVLQPAQPSRSFPCRASTILPVDPGRLAAGIDLRHPPHARPARSPGSGASASASCGPSSGPLPALAVKIRCRSRRTSPSACAPVNGVPVQNIVLRSVHHARCVQLAHRFRRLRSRQVLTGSPDPRQLPFGPGTSPVSGQLSGEQPAEVPVIRAPVSCCLSATGIRFSGHPAPARGAGPSSRFGGKVREGRDSTCWLSGPGSGLLAGARPVASSC